MHCVWCDNLIRGTIAPPYTCSDNCAAHVEALPPGQGSCDNCLDLFERDAKDPAWACSQHCKDKLTA